jgi:hypothetical protein
VKLDTPLATTERCTNALSELARINHNLSYGLVNIAKRGHM